MHCQNVQRICHLGVCKVVGLVCNVGLLSTALGLSFLDKGVGTGPTGTHLGPDCAQTTPSLPSFSYMPMASRAATKKLWRVDIIWRKIQSLLLATTNKSEQQKALRAQNKLNEG